MTFAAHNYTDAPLRGVWYCDKPYEGTMDYPAVAPFDHTKFWRHATDVSRSLPVLVSERQAPEDWIVLDEWSIQRRITPTSERKIERIYVHERWKDAL